MKKRDFWVVGAVMLTALLATIVWQLSTSETDGTARVYLDGALYAVLPLDENTELSVEGKDGSCNVVEVSEGRVRMKCATCPNQTCVSCGWRALEDALLPDARWIVCLPNRVSIELVGE